MRPGPPPARMALLTMLILAGIGMAQPARARVASDAPPGVLLLGTGNDGVLRSIDGGETWQPSSDGLPPGGVWQVLADPTLPGVAYAATGSLFRTTDAGEHWQPVAGMVLDGPGITALSAQGGLVLAAGRQGIMAGGGHRRWALERVIVPGGPPRLLLAAGQDLLYAVNAAGMLYLRHAPWAPPGADWLVLGNGLPDAPITALTYVPQSAQPDTACGMGPEGCIELFAAVARHGLWQSIDSGQHWGQETAEHDALPPTCTIRALLPSADDPQTAYAAVAGGGLYRSHSAGQFWKAAAGATPAGLSITALAQVGGRIVAATQGQGVQVYDATRDTFAWRAAAAGLPPGTLGLSFAWLPQPVPQRQPRLPGPCARVEPTSPFLVCGLFLSYFRHAVQPPTAVFGGVISPLEYDPADPGLIVQYFFRARFEYRPNLPGSVGLTPLGTRLTAGYTFPRTTPAGISIPGLREYPHSRFFPETGYSASGFFLKYWYQHGLERILGYPISSVVFGQNGDGSGREYAMQYFQNARMEYHPERIHTHFEVSLGLLGQQYYQCVHTGAGCHVGPP